jgi:hypothetical protein
MRWQCDTLADQVVEALDLNPGKDALQELEAHLHLPTRHPSVERFWQDMHREPPEGINAAVDGVFTPAVKANRRRPSPSLAEGQAVFARYSYQIFMARKLAFVLAWC